ncbi:MAG TPA: hypothetical protein VHS08_06520 [Candidatus Acidoferrales bacterium]|nr:hypothetical protein [Candidatus Acidoferrales bacterium]
MSPAGSQHTDILSEGHRFSIRNVQGAMMFRLRKSFLGTRATVRASVLRKILPVPESIRIEADEFVFTMAAAFGDVEVLNGDDGLLTIPGDADSLVVAISTLCGNLQLRHKLGCAAQEKMKRFTWKLSALRHEAVFQRAMGFKPVPTVAESQETNIGGASYSGKVVSN